MKPKARRNVYLGLLLATIVAAVLAPDDATEPVDVKTDKARGLVPAPAFPAATGNTDSAVMAVSLPQKRGPIDGNPVDLFQQASEQTPEGETAMPHAPTAPPLPFLYMGKALYGGKRNVFLLRDDKPYVVKSGDVLDGTYRVDTIKPTVIELTYLPLSQKQVMRIGDNK